MLDKRIILIGWNDYVDGYQRSVEPIYFSDSCIMLQGRWYQLFMFFRNSLKCQEQYFSCDSAVAITLNK